MRAKHIALKKRTITRYFGLILVILGLFFLTELMPLIVERVFNVVIIIFGGWLFMVYTKKPEQL